MRLLIISALSIFFFMSSLSMQVASAASSQGDKPEGLNLNAREISTWKRNIKRRTEDYDQVLNSFFRTRENVKSQIYNLRSRYPQTHYYQPFSHALVKEIERYAFIADTSSDKKESNDALVKYDRLLKQHIIDLDVVSFALKMSQLDVKFGDEYFLREVKQAILDSMNSGQLRMTGETAERAYKVITYSEENEWLAQIGGVVKKSELFDVRGTYYNVHDVETQDGEYLQVFMDVTQPIKMTYIRQEVLK